MKLITVSDLEYTYSNYPFTKSSGTAIAHLLKQRKIFLSHAEPILIKIIGAANQRVGSRARTKARRTSFQGISVRAVRDLITK